MFKVKPYFRVSIVNFEEGNAGWVKAGALIIRKSVN